MLNKRLPDRSSTFFKQPRRCLILLGTFSLLVGFQMMFAFGAQERDGFATKASASDDSRSAAVTSVVVTPANTQGWAMSDTRPGGVVNYVYDAAAPTGFGALRLTTDATNTSKADYFHGAPAGTTLASLTELAYFTKQVSGQAAADPAYQLPVCLTGGNGAPCNANQNPPAATSFSTLVFEPYLNPTQGSIVPGAWQQWDVDAGLIYSTRTVTCSGGTIVGGSGSPLYTLGQINTICPAATVLGYGVNIGTFNPNYNVETDQFDFNGTIYNFEPTASIIVVDDDGMATAGDCNAATPASATIQGAVNAANPGDTIQVCPGTYNEGVLVGKTLTINGAQAGVDARTRPVNTPASESIVTGSGHGFRVVANNVVVNGFTFQANLGDQNFGAAISLANTFSGSQILNNLIANNTIGISLQSNGAAQTVISRNAIRTNNAAGSASGNGIYSDAGVSNVLIDSNEFTNNASTGMVIFAGYSTIPAATNINVSNNKMNGNGTHLDLEGVNSSTVTGNLFNSSTGSQVYIENSNNLTLTCNTISNGPTRGIRVEILDGFGPSSALTINNNNIQNNAVAGLQVGVGAYSGATLDAKNNYWGNASGPTIATNPTGTGDKIVDPAGKVVYQPFLTVPSSCAPVPPRNCGTVASPYNVVTEFSLGSNPNCEFSYGYTANAGIDSAFVLYPLAAADVPVAGIDRWYRDSPDPDLVPSVFHNRNATTTTYGSVQHPANELNIHPGNLGERSVVRFTVPQTGRYTVTGRFEGIDTTGTTTDVAIVRRAANNTASTSFFAGNVNGFANFAPFNFTTVFVAGQLVDFTVGYGANQNYNNDSTGLSAVITYLGPTAAGVTVSGRVMTSEGRGVRTATVTITDSHGVVRQTVSGVDGMYSFDNVESGQTYVMAVRSRRYQFEPRIVNVTDNLTDLDFIAGSAGRK